VKPEKCRRTRAAKIEDAGLGEGTDRTAARRAALEFTRICTPHRFDALVDIKHSANFSAPHCSQLFH
jgi:hypothetical protein